jgi:hypothetical protein
MTTLRQACLVAAVLWVGMHLWHGFMYLDRHAVPALGVLALCLGAAVSLWAAAPLVTGRAPLGQPSALVVAVAGVAVALLVCPFLDGAGVRSYANWPPGGLGVLIAALVMRGRPRHAFGLAGATCVIVIACVIRTAGFDPVWCASLCVPPALWLGSALLVRRSLDRASAVVSRYTVAAAEATRHMRDSMTRELNARMRRDDLEREVLPLLHRLATTHTLTSSQMDACAHLGQQLRDDLGARYLLDAELREVLATARAHGTSVRIMDDRADPGEGHVSATLRSLIAHSLPVLVGAEVSYRISPDHKSMTVVARGEPERLTSASHVIRELGFECVDIHEGILFGEHDCHAVAIEPGAAPAERIR